MFSAQYLLMKQIENAMKDYTLDGVLEQPEDVISLSEKQEEFNYLQSIYRHLCETEYKEIHSTLQPDCIIKAEVKLYQTVTLWLYLTDKPINRGMIINVPEERDWSLHAGDSFLYNGFALDVKGVYV